MDCDEFYVLSLLRIFFNIIETVAFYVFSLPAKDTGTMPRLCKGCFFPKYFPIPNSSINLPLGGKR
jgi:hypothetical protein